MTNEENIEPQLEETVEETQEEMDPNAPAISPVQMSLMLSNQTFAIIGAIGQGLKTRYDQIVSEEHLKGLPPKVKKEKKEWNKGYIQALNDVAQGLAMYQDEITERAIADGTLTRDEVPDLPEPQATATETVEGSE